ncbi:MAG: alpha/beta fold hydrolase [Burkholderiales bacterium]
MRDLHDDATPAPYRSPRWLLGGHAQTIYPQFLPKPSMPLRRERVDTHDGDFWDVDWLDTPAAPGAPLVVLFHGLEGNSASHYARNLMRHLAMREWRGVIPHFRGCGGEPNRLPRAYHSGDYEEVGAMLAHFRSRFAGTMYAFGVSLGGSALLNWIGRAGEHASGTLRAAATVSVPLDLMAAGTAIDQGLNRIYARHFLHTLKPKALAMARRFPGSLDVRKVARVRSMWDFDEAVTAPLHGFAGADDYWTRASSKPWLAHVRIPTLVINARNDPFVPAASLPTRDQVSTSVVLEQPEHGGHCGFMTGSATGRMDWMHRRILAFFAAVDAGGEAQP